MKLEGKKVNFLGDSITEGAGTSAPDKKFSEILLRDYHLAASRNYGIGGTRIARQTAPAPEGIPWNHDFCMRVDEMDSDADIVVIFGGTNDFGHGDAPVGVMTDRTPETFCGAVHYLFEHAITRYPEALIVVVTPLHRHNEDNPCGDWKTEPVAVLKEYVDIIRATAEEYSLPVLDLYRVSGLQPKVSAIRERYMPDGLHPNDAGHILLSSRIAHFIESL